MVWVPSRCLPFYLKYGLLVAGEGRVGYTGGGSQVGLDSAVDFMTPGRWLDGINVVRCKYLSRGIHLAIEYPLRDLTGF